MVTTTTEPGPAKTGKNRAEPKAPKAPKPPKPAKVKAAAPPLPKPPAWASPVKPSLILLPLKSRGLKARRQAMRRAMFMSLGLLGVTAAAYIAVVAGAAGAQAELNSEKAVTAKQTAFLAQNRDVQEYSDGFLDRREAASTALEQDVAFSRTVQALQAANSVGAVFTSVKTADPGSPCKSPNPFAPSSSLGCLDVSGTAPTVEAVAKLVSSLNNDKTMLTEPYLTSSTATEGGISFKISVGYTGEALSMKGQKFEPSVEEVSSASSQPKAPATQGATS